MSAPGIELQAHDYTLLERRWRRIATRLGTGLREFTRAGGHPVYFLEGGDSGPAVCLSAGIHGDESAGAAALAEWTAANPACLRRTRFLVFPCLNPWGLIQNSRFDKQGRDLNRTYHGKGVRQTNAHLRVLAGRRFDLALTLHEDYDGRGVYLYELPNSRALWGESLIAAAARHLPSETRRTIEGNRCRGGVIRPRLGKRERHLHPEAILLHLHHGAHSITFETPSEFHIRDRIRAQCAMLDAAFDLALEPVRVS